MGSTVRSWELAQAARSPGQAAGRATGAPPAARAADEQATKPKPAAAASSAANEPAATAANEPTAATSEAAAPTATTSAAAATATTASAGELHATTQVLPIEEMERGETDVGHFLFVKNEALVGRGIVGLRDISSRHPGCGCVTHQRKTQSGGT
jgi:hypothetical protein